MLGFILLCLVIVHEIYILFNMKHYYTMTNLISIAKGRDKNDEIYIQADKDLNSNKHYPIMCGLDYIRVMIMISLLFTQYWLIALVLFALGFIVYKLKNSDCNIYINYLDSFTTIIVIVLGLVIL